MEPKGKDRILEAARSYPQTREIEAYLENRGVSPSVAEEYIREGVAGTFTGSADNWAMPGAIRLKPMASANTQIHELVHAAQRELSRQRYYTQEPNQFTQAYDKLVQDGRPLFSRPRNKSTDKIQELADILYPDMYKEEGGYRSSSKEIQAFAVGNTLVPSRNVNALIKEGTHLEPTITTEFMMLLDLAAKESRGRRKTTPIKK